MAGLRILYVEDHAETRELMERLLRHNGHQVFTAGGATDAIAIAGREPLDLLITDIGLPDGDGCELLIELRKNRPALRAVAVTGHAIEELPERCREAGFGAFVRKPVLFSELLAAVDALG
jgi:CheY-like chemotaxis protein